MKSIQTYSLWSKSFEYFSACVDCVVAWGEWNDQCVDGQTFRSEFVSVAPEGVGKPCPELNVEYEGKLQYS